MFCCLRFTCLFLLCSDSLDVTLDVIVRVPELKFGMLKLAYIQIIVTRDYCVRRRYRDKNLLRIPEIAANGTAK